MEQIEDPKIEISTLLEKNKVAMASRLCKRFKIDITSFSGLNDALDRLYANGRYQEILNSYRTLGVFGKYSTGDLLKKLSEKGNDSSVLKNAKIEMDEGTRKLVQESVKRRIEVLVRKGALVKASRACRRIDATPDDFPAIMDLAHRLHLKGQYQIILGAIYEAGNFGGYSVDDLLGKLAKTEMQTAFLVNAYRFGKKDGFEREISRAIQWHRDRGLNDVEAWERKFSNLEALPTVTPELPVRTTIEVTRLRPIIPKANKTESQLLEEKGSTENDPYIVSKTARVKLEKASIEHQKTLECLEQNLASIGFSLSNSKLIDLMGRAEDRTFIFEVKSITQDNERDQVRHAVSQLFEYRFLHKLPEAKLFVVFSREPFSWWLVDYLREISINVIWVDNDEIEGPDEHNLDV